MAECMLNFESLRLDVVEAVRSGKRNDVLHAPAVRRMQLAQQQRLVQDQEARHGELERVLETADRERAYRGSQAAEDDETDAVVYTSSFASTVNESEIDDPNKPLSLGDFVEDSAPLRVPTAVCQAACPSQATQVNYMSLRPQHAKHRHPIEQQHQQLNSIYSLPQWYMYRLHLLIT
ncbi:TPA: hypothetical protein ACH3X2_000542 [Trebouxia sp. C0005]